MLVKLIEKLTVSEWAKLPTNAGIAARWVRAGTSSFECYSRTHVDKNGSIHEANTPKTAHGFKDASNNMVEVLTRFVKDPEAFVGIPCETVITLIDVHPQLPASK
jgi:hypothetical protein